MFVVGDWGMKHILLVTLSLWFLCICFLVFLWVKWLNALASHWACVSNLTSLCMIKFMWDQGRFSFMRKYLGSVYMLISEKHPLALVLPTIGCMHAWQLSNIRESNHYWVNCWVMLTIFLYRAWFGTILYVDGDNLQVFVFYKDFLQ